MVLDSTVAGANSDSYLSVADADALAAADLGPEADAWRALNNATPADLEKKERALKRATREIDASLRSGWRRFLGTQALRFPRLRDYRGWPAVAYIPTDVRRACFAQAKYVLRNAAIIDNARMRRSRDLQGASEPNTSYTERAEETAPPVLSDEAEFHLASYRRATGSRRLRSVRMASGWA